jgi:hypothetical protein
MFENLYFLIEPVNNFQKHIFTAELQRSQRSIFMIQSLASQDWIINPIPSGAETLCHSKGHLPRRDEPFDLAESPRQIKNLASLRPLRLCGEVILFNSSESIWTRVY